MKRVLGIIAMMVIGALSVGLSADTFFTTPVIVVTPRTLEFGAADPHHTFTNTFLVENAGVGRLIGKVSVKPPFKILDGGSYTLLRNEAQVVTIVYLPTTSHSATNAVRFTGGGGAHATVIGIPTKRVRTEP